MKFKTRLFFYHILFLIITIILSFNTQVNAAYCNSKGSISSYEFVNSIALNGEQHISGNSFGYLNATTKTFNVTKGSQSIKLSAGYSGYNYVEQWSVWVDLNQDQIFTSDERLLTSSGVGSLTKELVIPNSALVGSTRMRVIMSYSPLNSACVNYTYGETEDYTLNISSEPIPTSDPTTNPVSSPTNKNSYCLAKGNSSNYEYIKKVVFNDQVRLTGNNNGYYNEALPFFNLKKGDNIAFLTPGFSSASYNEYWSVWVDFNQDKVFQDTEKIINTNSNSFITSNFQIPQTALLGETGLRVAMSYAIPPLACGSFSWGEVEDYKITISEGNLTSTPPAMVAETLILSATDVMQIYKDNGIYSANNTLNIVSIFNQNSLSTADEAYGALNFQITNIPSNAQIESAQLKLFFYTTSIVNGIGPELLVKDFQYSPLNIYNSIVNSIGISEPQAISSAGENVINLNLTNLTNGKLELLLINPANSNLSNNSNMSFYSGYTSSWFSPQLTINYLVPAQ